VSLKHPPLTSDDIVRSSWKHETNRIQPYPQKGVADGLAFSTQSIDRPVSLERMLWEARSWAGTKHISHDDMFFWNDLSYWASQGVLLINSSWSTEIDQPGAHNELWEPFTKAILNSLGKDVIVCALGKTAQSMCGDVKGKRIFVPHPAARNGEFKGCDLFNQIDKELVGMKVGWTLPMDLSTQTVAYRVINYESGSSVHFPITSISKAYLLHKKSREFIMRLDGLEVQDLQRMEAESHDWKDKSMIPSYLKGIHVYHFIQNVVAGCLNLPDDTKIKIA